MLLSLIHIYPRVTDEVRYFTADEEDDYHVAQANTEIDENGYFVKRSVAGRYREDNATFDKRDIDLMDVSPKMVFSVATSMIPVSYTHLVQQYGINIKTAAKIYEFYGDQAYSIIKENPYRLIEDIKNIGFKTADQIAIKTGAFENSSFRIKAAITYSLEQAAANGHTYLPKSVLYRYIGTLIQDVNTSDVDSCLEKMSTDSKVIIRYNAPEKSVAGDDYDLSLIHILYKLNQINT